MHEIGAGLKGKMLIILVIAMSLVFPFASGVNVTSEPQENASLDENQTATSSLVSGLEEANEDNASLTVEGPTIKSSVKDKNQIAASSLALGSGKDISPTAPSKDKIETVTSLRASISELIKNNTSLTVEKLIIILPSEGDKNITYWIKIKNTGNILLKNVFVNDTLPNGFEYLQSNYLNLSQKLKLTQIEYNENDTIKQIIWNIGDLDTRDAKWIELKVAKREKDADGLKNKVEVSGQALGTTINSSTETAYKRYIEIDVANHLTDMTNTNDGIIAKYSLKIKNPTYFGIKDLMVQNLLPTDAIYRDSTSMKSQGRELSKIYPGINIDNKEGCVLWKIDEIAPNETLIIDFSVLLSKTNPLQNKVKVSGSIEEKEIYSNIIKARDYR
jgi:uncharacterized repeat protein (TIGR01451 family)